jgi:hypothetical protein
VKLKLVLTCDINVAFHSVLQFLDLLIRDSFIENFILTFTISHTVQLNFVVEYALK